MSKEKIINKVVDETVDTLIDNVWELLQDYMYEYGNYTESNDEFYDDYKVMEVKVVEELYNRIKNK
jgi:hypothetical protein